MISIIGSSLIGNDSTTRRRIQMKIHHITKSDSNYAIVITGKPVMKFAAAALIQNRGLFIVFLIKMSNVSMEKIWQRL